MPRFGSFVAALASRHRLISPRTIDRRLLLLRLLVWLEQDGQAELGKRLQDLPELVCGCLVLWLQMLNSTMAVEDLLEVLLGLLALLELLGPEATAATPPGVPAWVPCSASGRRGTASSSSASFPSLSVS